MSFLLLNQKHRLSGNASSCLVKKTDVQSLERGKESRELLQMMLKKDECTLSPNGTDRRSPASSPKLSIRAYHVRESHPKRQAKNNFRIEPFASLVRIWPFRLKHQMQLSFLQTCPSLRIIIWVVKESFAQSSNENCSCWVPNVKHVKPMAAAPQETNLP